MTDDQHGGGVPGSGRWDPLPQGDYDDGATAFVQLPEGGIDALLAADSPLAAPGQGYVPPQFTPTPTAATDPTGTGNWAVPGAPAEGARWPDPNAVPQNPGTQADDRFTYPPQATQHWTFDESGTGQAAGAPHLPGQGVPGQGAPGQGAHGQGAQGQGTHGQGVPGQGTHGHGVPGQGAPAQGAPGQDVTGQWSIPVAGGDIPDESGEFTTSSLIQQWGGTPPATLPGGAPAPWATETVGEAWSRPPAEAGAAGQPGARQPAGGTRTQGPAGGQYGGTGPAQDAYPAGTPADGAHGGERAADARTDTPPAGTPHPGPATPGQGTAAPAAAGAQQPPAAPGPDAQTSPGAGTGPGTGAGPAQSPAPGAGEAAAAPAEGPAEPPAQPGAADDAGPASPAPEGPAADAGTATPPQGTALPDAQAADAPGQGTRTPDAQAADAQTPDARTPDAPEQNTQAPDAQVPDAQAPDAQGRDAQTPEGGPSQAAPAEEPPPAPPQEEHPLVSYVLRVNGVDRPVTDAWIGESLLYVLRERLGLAGAKDGCSQGECGACNVQVDGRLVASCLVPAATAAGSEVRTVEGLAVDGELSDVQRALVRCGAVQCGFCVPGMAMTVHDLLEGNPDPTELETRQALCGNLCRCSGYRGVLRAVKEVVAERAAAAAEDDAEPEADAGTETAEPRIPHQAGPGEGGVHPSALETPHPHDPYGQDGGQA